MTLSCIEIYHRTTIVCIHRFSFSFYHKSTWVHDFILFKLLYFFFFFQAEDGIRDIGVTGVQTCALPISLVKYGNSPCAIGETGKAEGTVRVALGECEVFTVRIANAYVALREGEARIVAAAVESLIRRSAHTLGRYRARNRIVAIIGTGQGYVRPVADAMQTIRAIQTA